MGEPAQDSRFDAAGHGSRRVLIACYAVLAALLGYTLVARYALPLYLGEPVAVQHPGPEPDMAVGAPASATAENGQADVAVLIDPNEAGWAELAQLPGIGEVFAKRIVTYREQHMPPGGGRVFCRAEDLLAIRGIGPKTIERIRPRLQFPPDPAR